MSNKTGYLVKGSLLRTVSLIVNITTAFFLMPFIVRSIGDRWYGIWVIVGGIMGYYGLLDFGISSATNRYIAIHLGRAEYDEVNVSLNTSLVIFTIIGSCALLISLLFVFLAPIFISQLDDIVPLRVVLLIMGIDVAFSFPFKVLNGLLSAKLRYDLLSYCSIGKTLIRASLMMYFVARGHSIVTLAVITLSVNFAERLFLIFFAKQNFSQLKIGFSYFDKNRIGEYINYSVYTFIATLADMIRFKLDNLVIAIFWGATLVTHYNVAINLHEYSGQLVTSLVAGTLPVMVEYYANNDYVNLRKKFLLITRFGLIISTAISGAVIIFARPFIICWMGEPYIDAVLPLIILRVISIFGTGQNSSVQIFYAMAKHNFYAYMTFGEAVINLILSISLVKYFGMSGVALGTAIPFFIAKFFIMPRYVCKILDLDKKSYYLDLIKIVFVSGFAHIPCYFIAKYLDVSTYKEMIALCGLYYPIYGIFLFKILLSEVERNYLLMLVPGLNKIKSIKSIFKL